MTSGIKNGFVSLCRTAAESWDSVSSLLNFGLSSRRGRCLASDPCGFMSDAQVNPWSRLAAEEAPLRCICFLRARQRQPVFIPPSREPERTGTNPDTRASVDFCAVPPFPSCRTSRGGGRRRLNPAGSGRLHRDTSSRPGSRRGGRGAPAPAPGNGFILGFLSGAGGADPTVRPAPRHTCTGLGGPPAPNHLTEPRWAPRAARGREARRPLPPPARPSRPEAGGAAPAAPPLTGPPPQPPPGTRGEAARHGPCAPRQRRTEPRGRAVPGGKWELLPSAGGVRSLCGAGGSSARWRPPLLVSLSVRLPPAPCRFLRCFDCVPALPGR